MVARRPAAGGDDDQHGDPMTGRSVAGEGDVTGTAGSKLFTGASWCTWTPGDVIYSAKLQHGLGGVLLEGDAAQGLFGNTLTVSSTRRLHTS